MPEAGELPDLVSVSGSLAIGYDTSSPAPALPPYLTSLGSVGSELRVADSFAEPVAGDTTPLTVGSLALDANLGLVGLAGAVSITDNFNITDCAAQDWVDAQPCPLGPVTISGNDSC